MQALRIEDDRKTRISSSKRNLRARDVSRVSDQSDRSSTAPKASQARIALDSLKKGKRSSDPRIEPCGLPGSSPAGHTLRPRFNSQGGTSYPQPRGPSSTTTTLRGDPCVSPRDGAGGIRRSAVAVAGRPVSLSAYRDEPQAPVFTELMKPRQASGA